MCHPSLVRRQLKLPLLSQRLERPHPAPDSSRYGSIIVCIMYFRFKDKEQQPAAFTELVIHTLYTIPPLSLCSTNQSWRTKIDIGIMEPMLRFR